MCDHQGCKTEAKYMLKQLIGKRQELMVCEKHLPKWAINNEELEIMGAMEFGCYFLKRI